MRAVRGRRRGLRIRHRRPPRPLKRPGAGITGAMGSGSEMTAGAVATGAEGKEMAVGLGAAATGGETTAAGIGAAGAGAIAAGTAAAWTVGGAGATGDAPGAPVPSQTPNTDAVTSRARF